MAYCYGYGMSSLQVSIYNISPLQSNH